MASFHTFDIIHDIYSSKDRLELMHHPNMPQPHISYPFLQSVTADYMYLTSVAITSHGPWGDSLSLSWAVMHYTQVV